MIINVKWKGQSSTFEINNTNITLLELLELLEDSYKVPIANMKLLHSGGRSSDDSYSSDSSWFGSFGNLLGLPTAGRGTN